MNEENLEEENFMEIISFDVFSYLLSFLPPIPYLFKV
jgi:hypothetical protein